MSGVEIYTGLFCSACDRAKQLLARKGIDYEEFDVSADAGRRREMMNRTGGRMSVPQVFIGGVHAGGYAELAALERAGQLDSMLGAAKRGTGAG